MLFINNIVIKFNDKITHLTEKLMQNFYFKFTNEI